MPNFFALPGFRKYFANTSWFLGERVLRMVGITFYQYLRRSLSGTGRLWFTELHTEFCLVIQFTGVFWIGRYPCA